MENLLKENGYKVTPGRLAILNIFLKNKIPLSAEIIGKKLKKLKIDLDNVTIYRTLSGFEKKGILSRVDLRKESAYFEMMLDHHHHIVCTKCDLMEKFKNSEIEKVIRRIVEKSSKFKNVKGHSFELFGVCKKCVQ